MKRASALLALGLSVLSVCGKEPAIPRLDEVAVSADSLARGADEVAVSAASVARAPVPAVFEKDLVAIVRNPKKSEAARLAALEQIVDQDTVFYLFVKPGEDRNLAVRLAALDRLADIDLVRAIGAKVAIPEIRKAVRRRLAEVYADARDRASTDVPPSVRAYLQRRRDRR